MGNQGQKNIAQQQLESQYRINHPILEETQIYISKNIMKTHLPAYEDSVIDSWMKSMEKIKEINKEYLLMPKTILFRENALCGTYSSLTVMYDCFPYVLMDEIENRRKIDGTFEEDQIWYLIWVLADASKCMIDLGHRLGDVRPHNILFNETGDVKVINKFSWPAQLTNYSKTLYEKTTTYLSPQQLQLLVAAQETDKTSSHLSQSFSIGLTILSVIYLEDLSKLYQFDPLCYGINTSKLASLLERLPTLFYFNSGFDKKLPYSHGLIRVVQRLCALEIDKRLGINRLWEWLKPHKPNIINFKPFELIRGISEKLSPDKLVLPANPSEITNTPNNLRSPIHLLQQSARNSRESVSNHKIKPIKITQMQPQPIHQLSAPQANSNIHTTSSAAHQLKSKMNSQSITQHQPFVNQYVQRTPDQKYVDQNHYQQNINYGEAHLANYTKQVHNNTNLVRNEKTPNITFSNQKQYKVQIKPVNEKIVVESRTIHIPKNQPTYKYENKLQTLQHRSEVAQKIHDTYEDDDIIAQVDRQLKKSKKLFPAK